jgi:hypothetical protein
MPENWKALLELYPHATDEEKEGGRRKKRFDLETVTRKGERP